MEKYSLSDIAALMENKEGGFLEGNGIIILLIFFLAFAGGGFGGLFGNHNANEALTRAELAQGLADNNVTRKLDVISNGLCDGFYAQNTTMLQGFNSVGQQIAENRYAADKCCCEINRNIDAVRYENAQNTCAIIQNATANTQKILDTMCANTIQELRDKVTAKDQELQTANFQLSQQAQNATLINALRPTPVPSYLTCSPYQSAFYAYNGLSNGCGGCCGNFA